MEVIRFAILGLGTGAVYALLAQSIVWVHRGCGVLNFAAGAIGMIGAFVFYELWGEVGLPWPLGLAGAILLCSLIGLATHWLVMRPLQGGPTTTKVVATLALLGVLVGVATLAFAPESGAVAAKSLLPKGKWTIASDVTVGVDRVLLAGIALLSTAGAWAMSRYTRIGLATTAVAESHLVSSAFGLSPNFLAAFNWALGSAIAGIAVIGAAPLGSLNVVGMSMLVVPSLAAALVGRFESFWLSFLGAMGIGIAVSEMNRYISAPGWAEAAPLLVIVGVLVLRGRYLPTKSEVTGRLPSVGTGVPGWAGLLALIVAVTVILAISPIWLPAIVATLISALVVLSIVVVTGYAGQISLAQLSIAGVAALLTAWLTIKLDVALWAAIPLAALLTVPVGMIVAVPALRTRGSNLAIATLALAVAINGVLLTSSTYTSSLIGPPIGPLEIFGWNVSPVTNPRGFALVCLAVLLIGLGIVSNVRRGATGRRMLAVRANERAAAALGISVAWMKLYAFGLGALIAGAAGGLLQSQYPVADFSAYPLIGSINAVLNTAIGGIGWAAGAGVGGAGVEGGLATRAFLELSIPSAWVLIGSGALAMLTVTLYPDGVIAYNVAAARAFWAKRKRSRSAPVKAPAAKRESDGRRLRPAPDTVLEATDVSVRFGDQLALDGVSLTLKTGEIVGLIGSNGAGKSTFIEVVSGFQSKISGSVTLNGKSIDGLSPARRAGLSIGRSFQSLELFEDMTVRDNLRVAAEGCPPSRYVSDIVWPANVPLGQEAQLAIDDFELGDHLDEKPGNLDHGRRRLVAIGRSVAASPSLLMLDEPAAGLSEVERRELVRMIRQLRSSRGIGVLLVEHDVDLVFDLCDRIVVLDAGRVIATGEAEAVRSDPAVIASYLGREVDDELVGAGPGEESRS